MEKKNSLGIFTLSTIVVGSMIGGGIFNMPKNIAQSSSAGAAIIGWLISGIGVLFLAKTFQILASETPDVTDGIYKYAKEGFGTFSGFHSAWGYWISNVISNASYPVLLVQTLNYFFPSIGPINSFNGIILGSILIWIVIGTALAGDVGLKLINVLATIGKVVAIFLGIVILYIGFTRQIFVNDFWGGSFNHATIFSQVKGCMLQTLWAFIGIEGAVVISDKASDIKLVGRATMIGYFISLFLYVFIVLLSYGVLTDAELAALKDPALSYIIEAVIGPVGATLVNIAVLISVGGAWLSWTFLTAEIPYNVALDGLFPNFLKKVNKNDACSGALFTNGILKQVIFFLSLSAQNAYLVITNSASCMILIPYIFSSLFLMKIAIKHAHKKCLYWGIGGVVYGVWMIYSSGLSYVFQSLTIYSLGTIYFLFDTKRKTGYFFQDIKEKLITFIILVLGFISFYNIIS